MKESPRRIIRRRRQRQCSMACAHGSRIAITMGDACGIGPEIVARLFALRRADDCFVIGDLGVMRRAVALVNAILPVSCIDSPDDLESVPPNCLAVVQPRDLPANLVDLPIGRVDARAGAAAGRCIELAVRYAMSGQAAAVVTAPIHKEAFAAAGIVYPGHTEMLQALAAREGAV